MSSDIEKLQVEICRKFNASYLHSPSDLKLGIAKNVWEGAVPINGLRHPPEEDTTGWYIWAGTEWSNDPEFFEPFHVGHLIEGEFDFAKYWRFLVTGDYEDVWYDRNLLIL